MSVRYQVTRLMFARTQRGRIMAVAGIIAAVCIGAIGSSIGHAAYDKLATSKTVDGYPRIIDGDTIAFGSKHIRFAGIDAPESHQTCKNAQGDKYYCGQVAKRALESQIGQGRVSCSGSSDGPYHRLIATCTNAQGENLNQWMVANGYAVAYLRYSHAYANEQNEAKSRRIGIWSGSFEQPSQWRREHRN